jgi:metal-responsive CopG/Arc/MetJ family transcriptional regulator
VRIQIAVRLPAQLVNSLDEFVASEATRSRASVVERALLRELRYQSMLQEVEILNSDTGTGEDLNSLARFSLNVTLNLD